MSQRTRAREQALQILYLIDLASTPTADALDLFRANFESFDKDFDFVRKIVEGVTAHSAEINGHIESHSENWKMDRMPRVDRNILRIGTYELLYHPDVPTPVVLDEAIELGKRFGDTRTASFVNGVLDRIFRDVRKGL